MFKFFNKASKNKDITEDIPEIEVKNRLTGVEIEFRNGENIKINDNHLSMWNYYELPNSPDYKGKFRFEIHFPDNVLWRCRAFSQIKGLTLPMIHIESILKNNDIKIITAHYSIALPKIIHIPYKDITTVTRVRPIMSYDGISRKTPYIDMRSNIYQDYVEQKEDGIFSESTNGLNLLFTNVSEYDYIKDIYSGNIKIEIINDDSYLYSIS